MRPDFNDLLLRALDQPEDERRAFLEANGADSKMCAELLDMLANEKELSGFLDDPAMLGIEPRGQQTIQGRRLKTGDPLVGPEKIGPYTILRTLGEGGMGVVYLAEQHEPVERQLAVKVIRTDLTDPKAAVRFDAERQALARLSHPNIAQLHDAGTTDQRHPYFAMEYFPGVSLVTYCDEHRLSVDQRLRLFVTICKAVQHAHQRGIIHRDLKPSNVLVAEIDGQPVAKVIDFGIAKAIDQPLTDALELTGELVIGTPAYMSPESLRLTEGAIDVDTRTDVYSLGVLLYELLTGMRPFSIRASNMVQVMAKIASDEAPRPSARLSSETDDTRAEVAHRRRTDVSALQRRLVGDLDWIVSMAIARNREDRYGSAAELAADVRRYLDHEPVIASPPSVRYRIGKFIRRHRTMVAAGILAMASLLAGTISTTIGLLRANREAAVANEVSEFLVGLFSVSDPSEARGTSITARELLDRGAARIEDELADQPLVRARLMDTMGRVYTALGLYDASVPLLEGALELRRAGLGDSHPDVATSLTNLAMVLKEKGELDMAVPLAEEALAIRSSHYGDEHPATAECLKNLAILHQARGEYDEAEQRFVASLEINRRILGGHDTAVAAGLRDLAALLMAKGDYEGAEAKYSEALDIYLAAVGENHPAVAGINNDLGLLAWYQGDYHTAETRFREALAQLRRLEGDDHPHVAACLNNLAMVLQDKGDLDQAETLYREVILHLERSVGPGHHHVAATRNNLATLLEVKGDLTGAAQLLREALTSYRRSLGDEHPNIAISMTTLASLLTKTGDYEEAEMLLNQALTMKRQLLGDEHPSVAETLNALGRHYLRRGNLEAAEPALREALLVDQRNYGDEHDKVASDMVNLAALLRKQGNSIEAEQLVRQALAMHRRLRGPEHPLVAYTLTDLAGLLTDLGRFAEAEVLAREAVALAHAGLTAGHPRIAGAEGALALCLAGLNRYEEAESLLLAGLESTRQHQGDEEAVRKAIERLVNLYTRWGKPVRAVEYEELLRAEP